MASMSAVYRLLLGQLKCRYSPKYTVDLESEVSTAGLTLQVPYPAAGAMQGNVQSRDLSVVF